MPRKSLHNLPPASREDIESAVSSGDLLRVTVERVISPPDTNLVGFAILRVHVDNVNELKDMLVTIRGDFDSICITEGCRIACRVQRVIPDRYSGAQIHTFMGTVCDYGPAAHKLLLCRLGHIDGDTAEKIIDASRPKNPLSWLAAQDPKSVAKRFNIEEDRAVGLCAKSEEHLATWRVANALCFKRGLGLSSTKNYDTRSDIMSQVRRVVETALTKPYTVAHYAYWHETLHVSSTTKDPRSVLDPGDKKLVKLFVTRPHLLASGRGSVRVTTVDTMVDARDDYNFDVYDPDRLCAITENAINRFVFSTDKPTERAALASAVKSRMTQDGYPLPTTSAVTLACDLARQGLYAYLDPTMRAARTIVEAHPQATGRFTIASDTAGLMARQTLRRLTAETHAFEVEQNPNDPAWVQARIYPHDTYHAQHSMSDAIERLTRGGNTCSLAPRFDANTLGLGNDVLQYEAVENAYHHNLSLLTGGPGRGKSQVIAAIVKDWLAHNHRNVVTLLSPTHKAKHNLESRLDALGISHGYKTRVQCEVLAKVAARYGLPDYEISYRRILVCVDEASMVDTDTMSIALEIISSEDNAHVVISGDDNQLPPIANGNPFVEMLKSNLPKVRLTTNHRTNQKTLIDLFDGIVDGDAQKICSAIATPSKNLKWHLTRDPRSPQAANASYAKQAVDAYLAVAKQKNTERPTLVTPYTRPSRNSSPCTTRELGVRIQNELIPWTCDMHDAISTVTRSATGKGYELITKTGWEIRLAKTSNPDKNRFRIGSEILITKQTHPKNKVKALLTNGTPAEIAGVIHITNTRDVPAIIPPQGVLPTSLIWLDRPSEEYYVLIYVDGQSTLYAFDIKQLNSACELAYAITTHKAQGSEYNHVIMLLPKTYIRSNDDHPFIDRNLIYTGMTRAQSKLTVIGDIDTFNNAIAHPTRQRLDGLSELI